MMIELTQKIISADEPMTTLTLPFEKRIKCRLRVTLDNGADAGLFLARGSTLQDGDYLASDAGYLVLVRAAAETLSTVTSSDPHLLARACYHLGNRHVSIQIDDDRVSYLHDHVLDEMLNGLGLEVVVMQGKFQPEAGAYGGSADKGHSHHHDHHH